jgi:uncharacterized Zn finger protein
MYDAEIANIKKILKWTRTQRTKEKNLKVFTATTAAMSKGRVQAYTNMIEFLKPMLETMINNQQINTGEEE